MAKPYDIGWQAGEDKVLLVSVATGIAPHRVADMKPNDYGLMKAATTVPSFLILSTVIEQDTLSRIFGRCLNGHQIDNEIGDLLGIEAPGGEHLSTYVRYNVELSDTKLRHMGLADIKQANVERIDSVDHIQDLIRVGEKVTLQVLLDHF